MAEELRLVRRSVSIPSPTLRDLLAVMFRQRRLVLVSFAAILISVFGYGLFAPSYQAQMKVLVRRGRVDPVVTPAPTQSFQLERGEVSEEELNSEVELLRDEDTLRRVVQTSGLASEKGSRLRTHFGGAAEQVRLERAVRRLTKRLTVEPVRKTTLINITYAAGDPVEAALVLQCLAAAYLEKHQRMIRPSGEFNFFEQQVTQSRGNLEQAEFSLMNFTRDEGVVSAALERDSAIQRLSEADANDRQNRVSIAETAQRIRTLQMKLQSLPERTTTVIRNSDNPELLEKMKSRLLELELKRTELLTKFEPSYRLVQEVDRQMAETKASIAAESISPVRDQSTDKDPDHQWAQAELLKSQVELNTLEARAAATGKLLAGYRETAHQLGDHAIMQDELLRNLKTAEDKYLLYVNKREEARIGDALDQGGILNVAIAEQPRVPALPARSLWSFAMMGALLATTLSTGAAFAADYLDPAFRTPDDVVAYLGSPVLASLPRRNEAPL